MHRWIGLGINFVLIALQRCFFSMLFPLVAILHPSTTTTSVRPKKCKAYQALLEIARSRACEIISWTPCLVCHKSSTWRTGRSDEHGPNDSQIITLDKVNKEPVVAILTYVSLPWNHTVRLLFEATLGCINQSPRESESQNSIIWSQNSNYFNSWLVNFRTKALWYRKLLGLHLGWFEKSLAEVPARRQAFEVPWFLRMCQEKGFFQISFCILKLNFAAQCTQDADSQFPPQSDRSRERA